MNTGEKFPYKIVFTESAGTIKGYALTYKEPNDTKATIEGTFDRRNHTLSFKETEIVYSHGFSTKAYMCLVDARLEQASGSHKMLKGPATAAEADKTLCTAGRIIFDNEEEVQKLFSAEEKFDTIISMKKKVKPEPAITTVEPAPIAEPLVTDKISANIEKSYDWYSDTVVIDIWDGGSQDGDKVTLQYNGTPLLTHYLLVKQKKQLRIPISGSGVAIISILAENEGLEPPNTASLWLTDGTTRYSVLAYNKKGEQAIIKIKRVR